jgi:hypothetical protein
MTADLLTVELNPSFTDDATPKKSSSPQPNPTVARRRLSRIITLYLTYLG